MKRRKIFINKINTAKFFNPKKITIMTISGIVFLSVLIMTFIFLKIDIGYIFSCIGREIKRNNAFALLVVVLLMFPVTKYLSTMVYLKPRMRRLGLEISGQEYFFLFLKIITINTITPFATGSEPYVIYWMKSRGADIEDANAISLIGTVFASVTEILITIPSFIYISAFYGTVTRTALGMTIYWFVFAGLCVNFIILSFFLTVGHSNKVHVWISMLSNFILRKLGRKYLTKEEILQKYKVDNAFKKRFTKELKEWKLNLAIICFNALCTCTLYVCVFASLSLIGVVKPTWANSNYLFNITNVAITANNFIPIPGAEGTIQVTIITLSSLFSDLNLVGDRVLYDITQGIGLWRIFTNYIPLIFSTILISFYYAYKIAVLHIRKVYNIPIKPKINSLSFVVTVNRFNHRNLVRCLDSILVNKQKLEIVIYVKSLATKEKVKKLLLSNPNYKSIKVIFKDGNGSKKIFRSIINNTKNKYITLINSDDYIHPRSSERINFPLENEQFDIIAYPQFIINDRGNNNQWIISNRCAKDNKEYFIGSNYISIYGMLFNRKYIAKHFKYFDDIDIYKTGISRLSYAILKADNFLLTNSFFYYHSYGNYEKETSASLKKYVNIFTKQIDLISNRQVPKYIASYIGLQEMLLIDKITKANIDKDIKKDLLLNLKDAKTNAKFIYKMNWNTKLRFKYCQARNILP